MKINSINQNQNFGRLKITATVDGKKGRETYAGNEPSKIFDEIDKISGKTPVEIKFDAFVDQSSKKDSLPFLICSIGNRKIFMYKGIRCTNDLMNQINYIKRQLIKEKKS